MQRLEVSVKGLNLHERGCLQYTLIRKNDTQKKHSYKNGYNIFNPTINYT